MATTINLDKIRYEKAMEEYRNSEDYKCKCPRCLSHKEPISRIDTKQEEYSYLFWLFRWTKTVETVIDKCLDCWHEFTEKDIQNKQSEFWSKYLDKHIK